MLPAAGAEDQQEHQTDLWSAYTAEGISTTSPGDHDREIRELRQQVQELTGLLESLSSTQRQGSERETRADWYPQQWESWQDGWWHDQKWTQVSAASSWWDDAKLWDSWQDLYRWADPSVCTSRKWDISEPPAFLGFTRKLSDVEEGCSEVEDDHRSPCGEVGYQGHELFGLDGAGIRGCKDFRGSTSATRRCGINPEGFGCQGWLDPGGRVQTSLAKGTKEGLRDTRDVEEQEGHTPRTLLMWSKSVLQMGSLVLSAAVRRKRPRELRSRSCLLPPMRAMRLRNWRLGEIGGSRLSTTRQESFW